MATEKYKTYTRFLFQHVHDKRNFCEIFIFSLFVRNEREKIQIQSFAVILSTTLAPPSSVIDLIFSLTNSTVNPYVCMCNDRCVHCVMRLTAAAVLLSFLHDGGAVILVNL